MIDFLHIILCSVIASLLFWNYRDRKYHINRVMDFYIDRDTRFYTRIDSIEKKIKSIKEG